MNKLLLSFYGDDFTGSTDALESLALAGLRTVLFTSVPTQQQLARYPDLQAFGVAGTTRSMPPDEIERTLRPALTALRDLATPIVHYKVCSTFDSSPTVGSIGRAIDVAGEIFHPSFVPVLVAAPALGRYCVFANLFARCGTHSAPYRLDRHPSMSRHPITPMHESDLRLHLARQTGQNIALFDIVQLTSPDAQEQFDRLVNTRPQIVLIDLLHESQLATAGRLLARYAAPDQPLFVVGSSGVESALSAFWRGSGVITQTAPFQPPQNVGPILAACGSCSPVTSQQIDWALKHGFADVSLDAQRPADQAARLIQSGQSVAIHTQRAHANESIGPRLGRVVRDVLESTNLRRLLVAGGDTSGHVARALGIESLEMIAELTRGAPLCRATAPGSPADGLEFVFKGGQIGPIDFFTTLPERPR